MLNPPELKLLGKWISEPTPENPKGCTLEFRQGGFLDYTLHGSDKDQIILMTYRVDGDVLITDQPSHPREERTSFAFTDESRLILEYDNQKFTYIRVVDR